MAVLSSGREAVVSSFRCCSPICSLWTDPNPGALLVPEIAHMYMSTARSWNQKYVMG